jgi:hypothetical protein
LVDIVKHGFLDAMRWADARVMATTRSNETYESVAKPDSYLFGFIVSGIQQAKPNGFFLNVTPKWSAKAH